MNIRTLVIRSCPRLTVTAAIVLVAALQIAHAYNGVIIQLNPFFFPNGTQVVSATGEPADAVLNRFPDAHMERIGWGVMTQYLNPGEVYEIWLEGSNDGEDFDWWVGSAKANARGNLNAFGNVYVDTPPGPYSGSFTSALATANLVIKTTDGLTMQTAYFPAP